MSDTKELLERARARFTAPVDVMDSLTRRRARKQRNQRIGAAALAIVVTLVTFAGFVWVFRSDVRPANEPTPTGIFSGVHGWIAYGNNGGTCDSVPKDLGCKVTSVGIWAVDPMRPHDPNASIQLSKRPGLPVAWSSDGSKLLIWRVDGGHFEGGDVPETQWLVVLSADGTETPVLSSTGRPPIRYIYPWEGSFSRDGSRIIVAGSNGIYSVDLAGGAPSLIRAAERRSFPGSSGERLRAWLSYAEVSPDGTQIAYIDGARRGGLDESLSVMNLDGTAVRVLVDMKPDQCPVMYQPAWSPDGTRLAFACGDNGVWEVGADGSALTHVIGGGAHPNYWSCSQRPSLDWSPDGTKIAYCASHGSLLAVADADGSHFQRVALFPERAVAVANGPLMGQASSIAWNPLPRSIAGQGKPSDMGSRLPPLVLAIALLAVLGVALLWRLQKRNPAKNVAS